MPTKSQRDYGQPLNRWFFILIATSNHAFCYLNNMHISGKNADFISFIKKNILTKSFYGNIDYKEWYLADSDCRNPFRHKALKHLSWESLPWFMVKIHTLNKLKYSIDKLQLILYSNAAFNSCMKYIPSQSHFMQFLTMLQKNAHGSTCGQSHFG